ncbi:MAG: flagellar export protein FliJ [Desulfosarcinaceae bacterium]
MVYQFKLEALRKYRQHQEEIEQKKLAEAQRNLEAALDQLNAHLARRERTEEELQRCQQQSATGQQLLVYLHFLQKLTRDIESQQEKVAQLRNTCDLAREDVLAAMKKRKALDKLKEKGLKRHLENLDHEEEKFISEMAISRFNHNHR